MGFTPLVEAALRDGLYATPIFIGSAITIVSCLVVIGSYFSYQELRRHPNSLLVYRSYLDVIFAVAAIVEQALRKSGNAASADCQAFSFITEFTIVGSEMFFFMMSMDLFAALRNPFINYKSSIKKYKLGTIAVSVVMAAVLIGVKGNPLPMYGMTQFGACWVRRTDEPTTNSLMWAFFYWVILAVYAWSVFVQIYARRRLSRGLRDTYEARQISFSRGVAFVAGYTVFWLLVAIVYWIGLSEATAPESSASAWVFCLFFTSRGFATMLVWLYNHNLKAVARLEAASAAVGGRYGKVNRQLQPHLNLALRREILHYTTLALRMSVVRAVGEQRVAAIMSSFKRSGAKAAAGPEGSGIRRGLQEIRKSLHLGRGGGGPGGGGHATALYHQSLAQVQLAAHQQAAAAAGTPPPAVNPLVSALAAAQAATPSPLVSSRTAAATAVAPGVVLPGGATTASPTAPAAVGASGLLGGNGSTGGPVDPDVIMSEAAFYAPVNDRKPHVPDARLSTDWVPIEIAMYASLFERGGMYDLGDLTRGKKPGAGAAGAAGAAPRNATFATAAGSRKSGVPPGSNPSTSPAYSSGLPVVAPLEALESDATVTPSSAHEGVIKRPPLELYDLAPDVFSRIRDLFGITPAQFLYSLSRTTKEKFSEGASGAFMCFSHDMRFVIKTMEPDEAEVLQRMLPHYLRHLRSNRDTLIIKFYSCMSLRLYRTTMYFVVMENIFPTRATIHDRFDLKGSWVGRSASKGVPGTVANCRYCNESFKVGAPGVYCPARPNRRHVANTVLKDNDLTYKLRLAPDKAARLGAQLRADTAFLAEMGVMDYSLLVGVHNRKFRIEQGPPPPQQVSAEAASTAARSASSTGLHEVDSPRPGGAFSDAPGSPAPTAATLRSRLFTTGDAEEAAYAAAKANAPGSSTTYTPFHRADEGGMMSSLIEGPGMFYMGIIDILQSWSLIKRVERWVKTTIMCMDRRGVSVMPPDAYASRFIRRVVEEVIEGDTSAAPGGGGGAGGGDTMTVPLANRIKSTRFQR